jgi:hypothetical protein
MTTKAPLPSIDETLNKIEPGNIRSNLTRAGLVLVAWEILQQEIEEKVHDFYCNGFDANGWVYSPAYQTKVLSRHKYVFEASLLWLVDSDALNERQADQVRAFRDYRNKVSHEMPKILTEVGHDIEIERISEMREVIAALSTFWGRIEIDTDPDLAGEHIADENIRSGMLLLMDHVVAAAR